MDGPTPAVSGYILEEVGDICRTLGGPWTDREGQPLVAPAAGRIADEIHAVLGVRLAGDDLSGVKSVPELGALVQAAMTRHDRDSDAASRSSGPGEQAQSVADHAALSSAQQRIWFMQQLAADSVLYNVPARLELVGPLDVAALRAALTDVWTKHDILRTRYPVASGIPRADVHPPSPASAPRVEMLDLASERNPDASLDRLAEEQARIPFRLDQDPPVRLLMVRCSAERHVLISTFHHIAVDWVTLNLLVRDLGARYAAHLRGGADPVDPPRWRYADVARDESSPARSALVDRAAANRCAVLGGVPPLTLPTDLPRPRFPRFAGDAVHGSLDESVTAAVRQFARQRRVTPFAVLMAGVLVLLSRASRQSEFIIGTPAAGRTRAEWQDVAGCFVNVVPVVARPAGSMSGADLVAQVSEATWQALEVQDVPFDHLVRALGRRAAPLVNVLFSYQPNPPRVPFPGLADAAPVISSPPGTAKYDLSLYVIGRGADMRLELEYDTDLYASETAAAVLRAYHAAVQSLVRDPDRLLDLQRPSGFESAAERTRERSAGLDRAAS